MSNKRMPIYFTSDLHIGHVNAIELDGRPFSDVEDMNRGLIRRWNATVSKDAIVYVLGDVGWCKGSMIAEVISQLNGTLICIRGNHDGTNNMLLRAGFAAVLNSASIMIAGERVTMTHCPLRGVEREDLSGMNGTKEGEHWHGESRETHKLISIEDEGQFHLHGHIHSPNEGRSVRKLFRQYDVGVVANNYTPVSQSTLESWITISKQNEKDCTQ